MQISFWNFQRRSPRISWNYANESWPISRDSGQNWALNCYWSCNTTLMKGRLHTSIFVVCWRKCLIEIKTFFQQNWMFNKRHQTCMLHVLTLLIQQMFYNDVWTCIRGFRELHWLPVKFRVEFKIALLKRWTAWRHKYLSELLVVKPRTRSLRWHGGRLLAIEHFPMLHPQYGMLCHLVLETVGTLTLLTYSWRLIFLRKLLICNVIFLFFYLLYIFFFLYIL